MFLICSPLTYDFELILFGPHEDTAKDVRTIVRILSVILTEHNVLTSSGIDQTHHAALRQHFNYILTRWGSSRRFAFCLSLRLLNLLHGLGYESKGLRNGRDRDFD